MSKATDQSEHDFLAFCNTISADAADWSVLHVGLSADLDQSFLIKNISQAASYLHDKREVALKTFEQMNAQAKSIEGRALSYIFADNDIILFAHMKEERQRETFRGLRDSVAASLPQSIEVAALPAEGNVRRLEKLAEQKIITARQMRALHTFGESGSKRDTLGIRRQRRNVPLVMLVEDDRFTAAYTTQLLAQDYEVFHVRSGEEAIEYYLDYAPDAVFLDLHLPGIGGTSVLQMIKAIDPDAYCVMLSVDTNKQSVIEASVGGAHSYLRKPYNKDRLLWTVRQSPHLQVVPASESVLSTPAQ